MKDCCPRIYIYIYIYIWSVSWAGQYADCISAGGYNLHYACVGYDTRTMC